MTNEKPTEATFGESRLSEMLGVTTRVFMGETFYSLPEDVIDLLHKKAKEKAWASRRLDICKCDPQVEYCEHCYPPEFRSGGKWDI